MSSYLSFDNDEDEGDEDAQNDNDDNDDGDDDNDDDDDDNQIVIEIKYFPFFVNTSRYQLMLDWPIWCVKDNKEEDNIINFCDKIDPTIIHQFH